MSTFTEAAAPCEAAEARGSAGACASARAGEGDSEGFGAACGFRFRGDLGRGDLGRRAAYRFREGGQIGRALRGLGGFERCLNSREEASRSGGRRHGARRDALDLSPHVVRGGQDQIDRTAGNREPSAAGFIEQSLGFVRYVADLLKFQETGEPLDGVEGAEDGVDGVRGGRVLFDRQNVLLDGFQILGGLGQEVRQEFGIGREGSRPAPRLRSIRPRFGQELLHFANSSLRRFRETRRVRACQPSSERLRGFRERSETIRQSRGLKAGEVREPVRIGIPRLGGRCHYGAYGQIVEQAYGRPRA